MYQILDAIGQVFWIGSLGDELQVAHATPNRHTQLVGIDDTCEPFILTMMVVLILAVSVYGATAQEPQSELAGNGGCVAGSEYDSACDVDHDSDTNIKDLGFVATNWGQTGIWPSGSWSLSGNPNTTPDTDFGRNSFTPSTISGTMDNFLYVIDNKTLWRVNPDTTGRGKSD